MASGLLRTGPPAGTPGGLPKALSVSASACATQHVSFLREAGRAVVQSPGPGARRPAGLSVSLGAL